MNPKMVPRPYLALDEKFDYERMINQIKSKETQIGTIPDIGREAAKPIQSNEHQAYNFDLVNIDVQLPMLAHDGSQKSEGDFGDYDLDKQLKKVKKKEKKDKEKKK